MEPAASLLHHLRLLRKLVEPLLAPVFALVAQGKACMPARAVESALARLEREFCAYLRRELVMRGFAQASDLPDEWVLSCLYGKCPDTDDCAFQDREANASSFPRRERGPEAVVRRKVKRHDPETPPPLTPPRTVAGNARVRAPP
jgi:hypothetical protein